MPTLPDIFAYIEHLRHLATQQFAAKTYRFRRIEFHVKGLLLQIFDCEKHFWYL